MDVTLPKIVQSSEQATMKLNLVNVEELKQDSFCIIKVEDETMMNIQYVISAHEPVVKFVNVISSENRKRILADDSFIHMFLRLDEDSLVNIIHILKLLAGKIYGTNY